MSSPDYSQMSIGELFRVEAETQLGALTAGLLGLERAPATPDLLESLMRASHSLKGAARIVGLGAAVRVAHSMEDCFVAVQKAERVLDRPQIDRLLAGVDLLTRISQTKEADIVRWDGEWLPEVDRCVSDLSITAPTSGVTSASPSPAPSSVPAPAPATTPTPVQPFAPGVAPAQPSQSAPMQGSELADRVLRVKADHLHRILGLAGESLVESRWLGPFIDSLQRLRQQQGDTFRSLDVVREALSGLMLDGRTTAAMADLRAAVVNCQEILNERCSELDRFGRRSGNLAHRLYQEALACRVRPFADGLKGFPRMVRDLALSLGKQVRLEIAGESTQVDRDILEQLEAPLTHLVRNAIDHGLELPEERLRAGKPGEGLLRLEARHSAGRLLIEVSEDGRGIEIERVRATVVARGLAAAETAARLGEAELLEFLFLPGFSVRDQVTEISGRGVGLDVVQTAVRAVRGSIRVNTEAGRGTRFQLQLPLTLSVLRTLLVEISGEAYAFPLAQVARTLKLSRLDIRSVEGRQFFQLGGHAVGLATAQQVLGVPHPAWSQLMVHVVVMGEGSHCYGLVVDRFLGEKELVVQTLDPRLGKVKDISAGAVMEDGAPVLIVDVEDLIRSIEKLAGEGELRSLPREFQPAGETRSRRILVVDDSLTVRELQRKLLTERGYQVDLAVDGMDGWNAVRSGAYDLLISDVDMPRMDGIELVGQVRRDPRLQSLRALIVSYKDRDEDRRRGLEAGADGYLTKGSFQDDTLLKAVETLIGRACP